MRVWDVKPGILCRNHLLGEHRELHAIWSILTKRKKGYSRHPETLRWKGKLKALYLRHGSLVKEMAKRGYAHRSPLDRKKARGAARQTSFLVSKREQLKLLRSKKCACRIQGIS